MHQVREETIAVRGVQLRLVTVGEGEPVVMCHGFPGLAHSFRHQLRAVADAGFRAVAVDMLGYGGSSAPDDIERYTNAHAAADLVALLDALGAREAVFVGHDFGAPAAWNAALRYPDRCFGLVLLSVPYAPDRMPALPSEVFANMAQKHFLHLDYFQQPGRAEKELDGRAREFLTRLYFALSGDFRYLDIWKQGPGQGYLDVLPQAPALPWSWLSEADIDAYAEAFSRTGFRGGLSWYRAMDENWKDSQYDGAALVTPTLFLAGAKDPVLEMRGEAGLARMRELCEDLRGELIFDGAGHWIQLERAELVSLHLQHFLKRL